MNLFMSLFISNAYAADAAAQAPGADPAFTMIFMIGMVVIFYFLLIRPQQKRMKEHRNMVTALKKGEEVVTNGGMLGKIVEMGEQYMTVEIADGVQVKIQRHAVATVLPKGSIEAAAKE